MSGLRDKRSAYRACTSDMSAGRVTTVRSSSMKPYVRLVRSVTSIGTLSSVASAMVELARIL